MGVVRSELDSVTLERDLNLEFEELVPDTVRSPATEYPTMPAPPPENPPPTDVPGPNDPLAGIGHWRSPVFVAIEASPCHKRYPRSVTGLTAKT